MQKWFFTKQLMEYLLDGSENPAIAIVQSCKVGWSMGSVFPFELCKVEMEWAQKDEELHIIESPDIPKEIHVYVENNIADTLPDPIIVDFIEKGDIQFVFIPPIPLPLHEYSFY